MLSQLVIHATIPATDINRAKKFYYPNLKTVDGIAAIGPVKSAWFKDSEGNILGITQMG